MPTSAQLQTIDKKALGLRSGEDAVKAAYIMSDFGAGSLMDIQRWIHNPALSPERLQAWRDHLYNTIWKIDDLDKGKGYNLLIVTAAKLPGKENYAAAGGHGDKRTFVKTMLVAGGSEIYAQKAFQSGHVDAAVEWVMETIK